MEADEYDNDSAFGESLASSTTSLRSAVTKYEFEHGRRYHAYKAGQYAFPNDESELDRMDLEHHMFGLLIGQLHLAPLQSPQSILDLGSGTGLWAIDAADKYPTAEVIGTDLSPTQPKWVPPNVRFEVDDFEADWTFGPNKFDLIFARLLLASVSDYPRLYRQAFDALKPGGYLELHELDPETYCDDGSYTESHAAMKWGKLFKEAVAKMGRTLPDLTQYKSLMEEAGFVDVQERFYKRASNDWPKDPKMKEIGRHECMNQMEGIEAFTLAPFTRVLGWSVEEAQVMIAQVRSEWPKRSLHGYQKV
ncbi:hypothetical protein EPUS_01452 [Endocarpon pusillum Z07020]|uniref:Methyltransferase n=1 Tax=Endocarpon pusillum (strain Z07020 / HMAS-L-300199) TaxID=1263415 RepID=U1I2D8_ENDPU|nr:uncharacterized protein EPUS_01452 [Endocarpon pusillum Z07020]ERF76119.1 hypothetical protein EPUS_01452 [Endocarpon pusillum Z07020]